MWGRLRDAFQFHCGAIKSLCFKTYYKNLHDFNSIVVRLKVVMQNPYPKDLENFNSIVVRLKASSHVLKSVPFKFQFHCGAIKSNSSHPCFNIPTKFQFHCGAIKSSKRSYFTTKRNISIPLWCD